MRLITEIAFEAKGKKMDEKFWENLVTFAENVVKLNLPIRSHVTTWCDLIETIIPNED